MSGVDQSWMERWCDTWRSALRLARKRGYVPTPKRQSAAALPRNLKRLREARGWTVAELAEAAQVSASTIRAMETSGNYDIPEAGRAGGKGPTYDPNPTLSSLLAVAEALEVGIGDLVEERET